MMLKSIFKSGLWSEILM